MPSSAKQAKKEFDRQLRMMRQQQNREHAWSEKQAQKQMQFQERMSSTAHQREMADLQAAGLNPILAAGSSGASTPAGSEPSYSSSLVDAMPQMFQSLNEAIRAAEASSRHSAGVARRVVEKLPDDNVDQKDTYDPDAFKAKREKSEPAGEPSSYTAPNSAHRPSNHSSSSGRNTAYNRYRTEWRSDRQELKDAANQALDELRISFRGGRFMPSGSARVIWRLVKALANVQPTNIPRRLWNVFRH